MKVLRRPSRNAWKASEKAAFKTDDAIYVYQPVMFNILYAYHIVENRQTRQFLNRSA